MRNRWTLRYSWMRSRATSLTRFVFSLTSSLGSGLGSGLGSSDVRDLVASYWFCLLPTVALYKASQYTSFISTKSSIIGLLVARHHRYMAERFFQSRERLPAPDTFFPSSHSTQAGKTLLVDLTPFYDAS
ncbi:hypothetical protein EI94DRAFT_1725699 [Lactarius quietus]|nr:hypothetical protein EI94DRAFT_1725699 [Lactarius quietus]